MMYGVSPSMAPPPYDPCGQHPAYAAPTPVNDWGRSSDPFPMTGTTVSPPRRPPSSRDQPQQMAPVPEMMYGSLPSHPMAYPPMMEVRAFGAGVMVVVVE